MAAILPCYRFMTSLHVCFPGRSSEFNCIVGSGSLKPTPMCDQYLLPQQTTIHMHLHLKYLGHWMVSSIKSPLANSKKQSSDLLQICFRRFCLVDILLLAMSEHHDIDLQGMLPVCVLSSSVCQASEDLNWSLPGGTEKILIGHLWRCLIYHHLFLFEGLHDCYIQGLLLVKIHAMLCTDMGLPSLAWIF